MLTEEDASKSALRLLRANYSEGASSVGSLRPFAGTGPVLMPCFCDRQSGMKPAPRAFLSFRTITVPPRQRS